MRGPGHIREIHGNGLCQVGLHPKRQKGDRVVCAVMGESRNMSCFRCGPPKNSGAWSLPLMTCRSNQNTGPEGRSLLFSTLCLPSVRCLGAKQSIVKRGPRISLLGSSMPSTVFGRPRTGRPCSIRCWRCPGNKPLKDSTGLGIVR